jgi:hypothetical protein
VVLTDLPHHLAHVTPDIMNILIPHMNVSYVLTNVLNVTNPPPTVLNVLLTELLYQLVSVQSDISMNKLLLVLLVELNVSHVPPITTVLLVSSTTIYT